MEPIRESILLIKLYLDGEYLIKDFCHQYCTSFRGVYAEDLPEDIYAALEALEEVACRYSDEVKFANVYYNESDVVSAVDEVVRKVVDLDIYIK